MAVKTPDTYVVRDRPCGSCPYAVSTPAGVWHPSEYAKLRRYDEPTALQPRSMFMCHSGDTVTRVCKGWLACHGDELLAYRLAILKESLMPDSSDFTCPVELHPSGAAAADHGLSRIDNPPTEAIRMIDKLARRNSRVASAGQ